MNLDPQSIGSRVKALILTHGTAEAERILAARKDVLARVAAGLPVRRATLVAIAVQLEQLDRAVQAPMSISYEQPPKA